MNTNGALPIPHYVWNAKSLAGVPRSPISLSETLQRCVTMIITDISVPVDAFPLGHTLQTVPEVEIEFERVVPLTGAIIPLFWVRSEHEEAVEAALRAEPLIETITLLTRAPERILYAVIWQPEIDGLPTILMKLGVTVLSADGRTDHWKFRLQFADRDQLHRFQRVCQEEGISLDLRRLSDVRLPPEERQLSAAQIDALVAAYEHGYWNVPRDITQTELAKRIGISDNALSERLRRGLNHIVEDWVSGEKGQN